MNNHARTTLEAGLMSNSTGDDEDSIGNIWITSRVRMQSHSRYRQYDTLSHVILTSYSVFLLAYSVFGKHLSNTVLGPFVSEISITLSSAMLAASLVTWGLRFSETAEKHKSCYLSLYQLCEDSSIDADAKQQRYHQILKEYPNHSAHDYESMLFWKVFVAGDIIKNRSGLVNFGGWRAAKFVVSSVWRLLFALLLVAAPLLFIGSLVLAVSE